MLRFLLWLLGAVTLLAQGELRLTVTDSAGVPMPASGTLNGRRFDTNARGSARLSNLSYGWYTVTMNRPGFSAHFRDRDRQRHAGNAHRQDDGRRGQEFR